MNVNVLMDFPDRFGRHGGGGWFPFMGIFGLLLLGLAVVALVLAFRGRRDHLHRGPGPGGPVPPPQHAPGWAAAPRADDAVNHLRMRYARGELSRDEYLRVSADLGAPLPAELIPTAPAAPPVAPAGTDAPAS
jgi:uncharacterized membrane protein